MSEDSGKFADWSLFFLGLLFAALFFFGCASAPPKHEPAEDSPQWKSCKKACEDDGKHGAFVFEDEAVRSCFCRGTPEVPAT